jgi:hypothetical protein
MMDWFVHNLDRILSFLAIVIATIAILDVRHLFQKLAARDTQTENRVRQAVLKELLTHAASFATFSRAAQFVEFYGTQPDKQASIAILMAFRFQELLTPNTTREQLAELRKTTRDQIEKESAVWAQMMIDSGVGKMKEGWEFAKSAK